MLVSMRKIKILRIWAIVASLMMLSASGAHSNLDDRWEIYLSPRGQTAWDGKCIRADPELLPLGPMAVDNPCPKENPCRVSRFSQTGGPCNVHILPGNYGGATFAYFPSLFASPISTINFTFGDVGSKDSITGLNLVAQISYAQTPTASLLFFNGANPSSKVILANGGLVVRGVKNFNTIFSNLEFVDFPISATPDQDITKFPAILSFQKCHFSYTKVALTLYVAPPAPIVDFIINFVDSKISSNTDIPEAFLVASNLTEVDLALTNSHFLGGVLLLAQSGGNIRNLDFENSVISTSVMTLFSPATQPGVGMFNSLNITSGTQLHSSTQPFNFFPPGLPVNPGTGDRYLEQLTMSDVKLANVSIRASLPEVVPPQAAFKDVNCRDCSLYLNTAGEPFLEGRNHFDLTSPSSLLQFNFGSFTSMFYMDHLSVYVKPELEGQNLFVLNSHSGFEMTGSLTSNVLAVAPGYYEFNSELIITEYVGTTTTGKTATLAAQPRSNVTLGSINSLNVAMQLQSAYSLTYMVTDPSHGIQMSPDAITPGVSFKFPKVVHIMWSASLPKPQLNTWYPLASFVDRLPKQVTVDQSGPLKGLQADTSLQNYKNGYIAVFRFRN